MINYQSPAPAARPPRLLHRSRGYSLVEMLVVMSASAMVLMVAYTLLVLVMKRTAGGNDELAFAESTSRISARFRQIVHESAELKVADDGQVLEMTSGTAAAAQWLQLASGPLRLELVEVKTGTRQIMGLTGFAKARFRLEKPGPFTRPLVTLELWPVTSRLQGPQKAEPRPIIIQAAAGLDAPEPKPAGGGAK